MAAGFGRYEAERDRAGNVRRHRLVFAVPNPETGRSERVRIDTGLTAHGDAVPFDSEATAKAFLESIRADIRNGRTEEQALAPYRWRRASANLVANRWPRFVEERRARRKKKAIGERRLRDLERYPDRGYLRFFDDHSVFELTTRALESWVDWLMETFELKPKSLHNIVTDFMGFIRHLKRIGDVREVPVPPELPPIERRRRPVPSPELLTRYLAAIPVNVRGLWLVRSYVGLRPSEARKLRVRDYDWRTQMLTISESKNDEGLATVPVDWELADWLERWVPPMYRIDRDGPLFRNPRAYSDGGWWRPDAEANVHNAACKELGVYFAPNHMGRHAAATHALLRSKERTGHYDVKAVQRLLRHADSRTTETYYIDQRVVDAGTVARIRPKPEDES